MTPQNLPTFDKDKKKKAKKRRRLIICLFIVAAGLFSGICYHLHRQGLLASIFPALNFGAPAQAPITPAPQSNDRCPVTYSDWDPYFFHEKLVYCDANFKCRAKTNIDQSQVVFADRFSDGLARISLKTASGDDAIAYLATSGKIEIAADPAREFSGPFSEGLAYSIDKESRTLGFIDKHGKYVISPRFYLSNSSKHTYVQKANQLANCIFVCGLAPVYTEKVNSRIPMTPACGYIDHKGKFVIPPIYLQGCAFVENHARINVRDTTRLLARWGFIDTHGNRVIQPIYMQAHDFSDSLAAVLDYQSRWGFVDKKGKYVIPAKFSDADIFSEGLAAAATTTNDKKLWGYIRKDGSWLIEPRFDDAGAFHNGEAHAICGDPESTSREDYWINKAGKIEHHRHQLIPFDIEDLSIKQE
jgi:hypothetical protein